MHVLYEHVDLWYYPQVVAQFTFHPVHFLFAQRKSFCSMLVPAPALLDSI